MKGAASIGIFEQARMVASYGFIEQRLFELLGGWVESESRNEARLFFDVQSQQHAWHAQLFEDRLPALEGLDAEKATAGTLTAVEEVLEQLAAQTETLVRLAGLGRLVLPRLVTGYTIHTERAAAVADASLVRSLRLVLSDEREAWHSCEELIETLFEEGAKTEELARQVGGLEDVLVPAGPGLVPWPGGEAPRELGS